MKPIEAAIVGAGLMGRWHAAYCARAGARVTAIVDPRRSSAEQLQRRHQGAKNFDSLEACLSTIPFQVIHICTPSPTHLQLIRTALAANKHVLVEKPLACTAADAAELLAIAREKGRRLVAVHQFPFQNGFRRLMWKISRLGQLVRLTFRTFSRGGDGRTPSERRNILLEILPHPYSLFRVLVGPGIDAAQWRLIRSDSNELEVAASINGVSLEILASLRGLPTSNEFSVYGCDGRAVADLFHGYSIVERGRGTRTEKILRPFNVGISTLVMAGSNLLGRLLRHQPAYPGLYKLIEDFYRSLQDGCPSPISEEEMLGSCRFIEQVSTMIPSICPG